MPHAESPSGSHSAEKIRRVVLCFDGTGNDFQGNTADTNVVKIYNKLDRNEDNQYHYYQPGIGTYDISGGSINKGMIGNFKSKITRSIDSAIATSFDAHVMAGYKFLMNYYEPGAKIYMFGFSRGAFTARFLARMVNTVGLLSRGNDEMIPFAYALYQDYEQAKEVNAVEAELKERKLTNFTSTFCRQEKHSHPDKPEEAYEVPIKIYFLGIFDCVRSVAVLETPFGRTPPPVSVVGTAEHVRHAVAVDEFRVKFKVALLNQDSTHEECGEHAKKTTQPTVLPTVLLTTIQNKLTTPEERAKAQAEDEVARAQSEAKANAKEVNVEDIQEVWFPGNHGDVGGGWPAHKTEEKVQRRWWQVIGMKIFGDKSQRPTNVREDAYQMSDIPLDWMIRELELIGIKEEAYALKWGDRLRGFREHFNKPEALSASAHNTMEFGRGSSWGKVLMWKFMDYIPLFPRYELQSNGHWDMQTWPPNMASARDIPRNALLHASLLHRLCNTTKRYAPTNNHGGTEAPCLLATKPKDKKQEPIPRKFFEFDVEGGKIVAVEAAKIVDDNEEEVDHRLYALEEKTITAYKDSLVEISQRKEAHTHAGPVTRSSVVNGLKAPAVSVQEISN